MVNILSIILFTGALYYLIINYGPKGFRANRLKRQGDKFYENSIEELDTLIEGKGVGAEIVKRHNRKTYDNQIKSYRDFKQELEKVQNNFAETFAAYDSYVYDQLLLAQYWYKYNSLVNKYVDAWSDVGLIDYDIDDIEDSKILIESYEKIFDHRYGGRSFLKHTKRKEDIRMGSINS
jgi:hypothetical protein